MSKTATANRRFTHDGKTYQKGDTVTTANAGEYDNFEAAGLIGGDKKAAAPAAKVAEVPAGPTHVVAGGDAKSNAAAKGK